MSSMSTRQVIFAVLLAFILGGALGAPIALAVNDGEPAAADSHLEATDDGDLDEADEAEADDETQQPTLRPRDFVVKVKIKEKQCFGSSGCSLTFAIDPQYIGLEDVSVGVWEATYRVSGGEDGPIVNTFTVQDGQIQYDSEEFMSTTSSSIVPRAKVTRVEPVTYVE